MFSNVADKEVPCRVDGCKQSWTWWGSEQIRAFGAPPPKRMCDEHLAAFHKLEDKQVECRNAGCKNTFTWKRGAQLHQLSREGELKTPRRQCDLCAGDMSALSPQEIECRLPGCTHNWTWSVDAQHRHGMWLRRERAKIQKAEAKAEAQAKAKAETEAKAKAETEAKAKAETEAKAKAKSQAKASEAQSSQAPAVVAPATEVESPAEVQVEVQVAQVPVVEAERAAPSSSQEAVAAVEAFASEAQAPSSDAQTEAGPAKDPVALEAESESGAEHAPKKRRRRRRRKKNKGAAQPDAPTVAKRAPLPEGPPQKLCGHCTTQLGELKPLEAQCKVHGCDDTWIWDVGSQLRAWVSKRKPDGSWGDTPPRAPRRMCNSCRDFCRKTQDRAVVCGKPKCEKTWMYKTGAQLQDRLAGRNADPIKLCEDCVRSQFVPAAAAAVLPEGAEIMPCASPACEGKWVYTPNMKLEPAAGDGPAPDRQCNECRSKLGLDARLAPPGPEPKAEAPAGAASELDAAAKPDAAAKSEARAKAAEEPAPKPAPKPAPTSEAVTEPERQANAKPANAETSSESAPTPVTPVPGDEPAS